MPEDDDTDERESGSASNPRFLDAVRKTTQTHAELFRRLAKLDASEENPHEKV
jgi:hypothetical protein